MKAAAWTLLGIGSALALWAAEVDTSKLPLPVPRKIDFAKEVWPILKDQCIECHGPEKQKGKYRMDSRQAALKNDNILPGNSEKSPVIHMVAGLIEEGLMPPPSDKPGESEPLTKEQIGILRAWIDQGAEWPDGPIQEEKLEFTKHIAPMLAQACSECHGAARQEGGFRVDTRAALLQGGSAYGKAVKPGDLKSPLVTIVSGLDEDLPVPEKHKLPPKQVETIKRWIQQGAE